MYKYICFGTRKARNGWFWKKENTCGVKKNHLGLGKVSTDTLWKCQQRGRIRSANLLRCLRTQ